MVHRGATRTSRSPKKFARRLKFCAFQIPDLQCNLFCISISSHISSGYSINFTVAYDYDRHILMAVEAWHLGESSLEFMYDGVSIVRMHTTGHVLMSCAFAWRRHTFIEGFPLFS